MAEEVEGRRRASAPGRWVTAGTVPAACDGSLTGRAVSDTCTIESTVDSTRIGQVELAEERRTGASRGTERAPRGEAPGACVG